MKVVKHKNGNVLGATILAPHAGEMILAWAHVIASRRKIGSMATVIAPYPTYGDASKRAAGAVLHRIPVQRPHQEHRAQIAEDLGTSGPSGGCRLAIVA